MCNRLLLRLKKISVQFARLERSNHHFYRLSFSDVIPSFRIISRIRKQEKLCIMHTNMRTPRHFLGIFGQKTPKKALKIYFDPKMFKIFPGRSLETSKNAKKKFRPPSMFSALVNTCCTGYFLAFEAHVWSAAKYSHTDF